MSPPFTVNLKTAPPEISAILERMIRIHPSFQDGDRDLNEREALRYLDFVQDGVVDSCDTKAFNEGLPFAECISHEDFQRAYRLFSKSFPKIKKLKLGSFGERTCPSAEGPPKTFRHQGIEILLKGHSIKIEESLLKAMAETAVEINPFLINPSKKFEIFWAEGLNLPGGNPTRNEFFSAILNFGPKVTSIGVWYALANQMEKDIEEWALNFRAGRTPGDKSISDFWGKFCQLHLKFQKRWDLLDLFDPSRYLAEIPKDWGFAFYHKHDAFVDDRHVFASVAVTARYFRKEFNDRWNALPEGETKKLAREIMNLVAPRFGINP